MINLANCYTTSQASKILKLNPRSIAAYIQRGIIKAEKIGRDWFIDVSEVDRFQRERRKVGRPSK